MSRTVICRRGQVEDLRHLKFAEDLGLPPESIEYNVVGLGHEFWIAIEQDTVVGFTVLAKTRTNEFTIMHLKVANSQKGQGIGSKLVQGILKSAPSVELLVVPLAGTEEFYEQLGFRKSTQWEMRRTNNATSRI
jgi:N-acetylglutamate synthase-like GNAT family acetyltransferase